MWPNEDVSGEGVPKRFGNWHATALGKSMRGVGSDVREAALAFCLHREYNVREAESPPTLLLSTTSPGVSVPIAISR